MFVFNILQVVWNYLKVFYKITQNAASCVISGESILSLLTTQFKFSKKYKLICVRDVENFVFQGYWGKNISIFFAETLL